MWKQYSFTILFYFWSIVPAQSEPVQWFEGGGAGLWTPSKCSALIHRIDNGSRLMVIWSETSQGSGVRSLFCQIVSNDGEYEYARPQRLTPDGFALGTFLGSKADLSGNLFFGWSELTENHNIETVFLQKIDRQGRIIWGDEGVNVGRQNLDFLWSNLGIIPDERGGCYFNNLIESKAINGDGDLRGSWQWAERNLEIPSGTPPFQDGDGGYWIATTINQEWGGYVHFNYIGERVDDQPFDNRNPEIPALSVRPRIGIDGGLLCTFSTHLDIPRRDSLGIFLIDEQGEYRGERFRHIFRVDQNKTWSENVWQLPGGRIVLPYTSNSVTLYDPETNSLPWGSGIHFNLPSEAKLMGAFEVVGGIAGNNTVLVFHTRTPGRTPTQQFHIRTVRPDGSLVGNEFVPFDGFSEQTDAVPTANGGFWLFGRKPWGYFQSDQYVLNRFNAEGNRAFENDLPAPFDYRRYMDDTYHWFDDRGVFHTIFTQYTKGIYHIGLNTDGEVVGDPNGRQIVMTDSFGLEANDPIGLTLDRRILYTYRPSHHDTLISPKLFSMSLSGELQWTIDLDASLPDISSYVGLAVDADQTTAAVMILHRDPEEISAKRVYVLGINLIDGRRIWQRDCSLRWRENGDRNHVILFSGDSFYAVNWLQQDSIYIDRYSVDGEPLWDRPFREASDWPERVFDAAPGQGGGLWLGKWAVERFEAHTSVIWLQQIDFNGDVLQDSVNVYSFPGRQSPDYIITNEKISLIPSGSNLWIVPDFASYFESDLGIQCLNIQNLRLMGQMGWQPEILGIRNSDFKALSDDEGGLWVFWNNLQDPWGDGRAMHFDSRGQSYEGWPAEGLAVSRYSYSNASRLWDGSIALLNFDRTPDGNSLQYKLQYLGEHDPENASDKPLVPADFELLSLFPQPFNNRLSVSFQVPSAGDVRMKLFDLQGREVYNTMLRVVSSGTYSTNIKLDIRPTGVYFLNLQFGDERRNRKVILLK